MAKFHNKLYILAKQVHNIMMIVYNHTTSQKDLVNESAITLAYLINSPKKAKKIRKLIRQVKMWYQNPHLYGYQVKIAICVSHHTLFSENDYKHLQSINKIKVLNALKKAKKHPELLDHCIRLIDFI